MNSGERLQPGLRASLSIPGRWIWSGGTGGPILKQFKEDPKDRACTTALEAEYGKHFGKNEEDARILRECIAAVRDHIAAEEDRIAKLEDRDGSFVASNDMNGLP